jgi:alpha-ribazole phosphatase
MTHDVLQCWWIRHLPVEPTGRYIGHTDIPAVMPAHAAGDFSLPQAGPEVLWFATPLLRSIDTAHWLLQSQPPSSEPLRMAPELMEHFGEWEGKSYEAVWQEAPHRHDWSKPAHVTPAGGENFADVCGRVDGWMQRMLADQHVRQLVMVAHAGSIRAALRHALGITPAQALSFQIDHGSVTQTLYYRHESTAQVNYVNR